jgi:hypothetical protein
MSYFNIFHFRICLYKVHVSLLLKIWRNINIVTIFIFDSWLRFIVPPFLGQFASEEIIFLRPLPACTYKWLNWKHTCKKCKRWSCNCYVWIHMYFADIPNISVYIQSMFPMIPMFSLVVSYTIVQSEEAFFVKHVLQYVNGYAALFGGNVTTLLGCRSAS